MHGHGSIIPIHCGSGSDQLPSGSQVLTSVALSSSSKGNSQVYVALLPALRPVTSVYVALLPAVRPVTSMLPLFGSVRFGQ